MRLIKKDRSDDFTFKRQKKTNRFLYIQFKDITYKHFKNNLAEYLNQLLKIEEKV